MTAAKKRDLFEEIREGLRPIVTATRPSPGAICLDGPREIARTLVWIRDFQPNAVRHAMREA